MTPFRIATLCAVILVIIGVSAVAFLLNRYTRFQLSGFRVFLLLIGSLLVLDTLIVSYLSNFNLGVILPAFFGLPLIVLAFLLPFMTHGFLLALKWFTTGCYALAGCIFVVCGFLMVNASTGSQHKEADAVIVLGAALHGERVTWVLSNRLDAAIEYLNLYPESVAIVSGGMGDGESMTEAAAMKKYMTDRGIHPDRIYEEGQARNTQENFAYSNEIIQNEMGSDTRIAYVTTWFHVFRAGGVAKSQGIHAFGIPAGDVWYIALNNFMRESVGICVYALRGII